MAIGQIKQKMTEDTLRKLDEVFAIDGSIEEACFFADIATSTYYLWVKENPELSERFNRLRNNPVLKARKTVNDKLGESYQNAMDYLKRKKKIEFGDNVDVTTGNKPIPLLHALYHNNSNEKDSEAK